MRAHGSAAGWQLRARGPAKLRRGCAVPGACRGLRGGAVRAGIGVRGSPSHCQPWICCFPCSHPSPGTSIPTTTITSTQAANKREQNPSLASTHCLPKGEAVPSFCWGRQCLGLWPFQDLWLITAVRGGRSSGLGSRARRYGGAQPSAGQLFFSPCPHTHITCFNFTQICHNFLFSELRMFPLLKQLCWLPVPEWI